jgi:hypothetical protein
LSVARHSQPRVNGDAFSQRRHGTRVVHSLGERSGAHVQHDGI